MELSPLDNRYLNKVKVLRNYFSDYNITKYRFDIEILYLMEILKVTSNISLVKLYVKFDYNRIKEIEKITNHDIKAIEYYIGENLKEYKSMIHFALTSQDINSMTNSLTLKDSIQEVINPILNNLLTQLNYLSSKFKDSKMISRTHGQSAVTTTMGKELKVYVERLNNQINKLESYQFSTKFGGAVGNLNAHKIAFPEIDWEEWMTIFCEKLKLKRNFYTTQVDHYDNLTELFDILKRINLILLDLNVDIWLYISIDYFKLKIKEEEVGSSTMPHKVNPINFENSEGNIHMANGILNVFINKLPLSRYQRDLSDSTICRNFGVALGYCLLAYDSLLNGLEKIEINEVKLNEDLDKNWAILTEAIQTVMRSEGISDAYSIVKNLSRGKKFSKEDYLNLVKQLNISKENKEKLLKLTLLPIKSKIEFLKKNRDITSSWLRSPPPSPPPHRGPGATTASSWPRMPGNAMGAS